MLQLCSLHGLLLWNHGSLARLDLGDHRVRIGSRSLALGHSLLALDKSGLLGGRRRGLALAA